jgi:hypothetical protein
MTTTMKEIGIYCIGLAGLAIARQIGALDAHDVTRIIAVVALLREPLTRVLRAVRSAHP